MFSSGTKKTKKTKKTQMTQIGNTPRIPKRSKRLVQGLGLVGGQLNTLQQLLCPEIRSFLAHGLGVSHTIYNFQSPFPAAGKFEFFGGKGIGILESFGTFRVDRSTWSPGSFYSLCSVFCVWVFWRVKRGLFHPLSPLGHFSLLSLLGLLGVLSLLSV